MKCLAVSCDKIVIKNQQETVLKGSFVMTLSVSKADLKIITTETMQKLLMLSILLEYNKL